MKCMRVSEESIDPFYCRSFNRGFVFTVLTSAVTLGLLTRF
jgi:hypothetical protein